MARTGRGIATEKAAVRAEQRKVALGLEADQSRKSPALGMSGSSSSSSHGIYDPHDFRPPFEAYLQRSCRREADAKPLKIEECLDMDLVKKGSFYYMSKNYVEEVGDWSDFVEEHKKSTF
ncbi:hypothetical protein Daesc_002183 [Daldinia eschscholtzii]|uniref:Uncharacterized protein n=1 Tax=Daldinia eschscholtzii TaxID=292717 RepID=A0AAX6MXI3_9PEZI